MIKRLKIIILAVAIVMALEPAFVLGREEERLPKIELKNVKLRGTVISGIVKPVAIIEDIITNKNYWYKEGDMLCGGRIVEIQRGVIVLDMNGSLCLFGLPEGEVEGVEVEPRALRALGKKVGDNIWKVNLDAAIDMLTGISEIMKEARIRPYFAIGKAAGIRIDRIKEGSAIKEMGLEDGDIIKGVNGFGLMSPTRIFEAYRKYKNSRLIQVQLLRDDRPITLTYNIVK